MDLEREVLLSTYTRQPVLLVRGQGCRVWDDEGREYLDLVAGIAVDGLGHSHPAWVEAVASQAARLAHTSNLFYTQPQIDLAVELRRITGMERCFFTNSGTEAVECALKVARKWGRKKRGDACHRFVTAERSFHGRTYGGMSATGQPKYQEPFRPLVPGFVHVPQGDLAALEAALDETVCAVMLETVQGEGGIYPMPPDHLQAIRQLCTEREILLILDEIQCGVGRSGQWMAYEHAGVLPDLLALAKGLGGGFPVGACLARGEAAVTLSPGEHGTTYGGSPLATHVAMAVLKTLEAEHILDNVRSVGAALRSALNDLCARTACLDHARGIGLMLALEFKEPIARKVVAAGLAEGVLLNATSETVLRIVPPLILSHADAAEAVEKIERSIARVVQA